MADDFASRTSFAAQHEIYPRRTFKVAPTDGHERFNAIRIPLIPVACWKLNDPGFAFDSSFVAPAFRDELATLSSIVAANPACPVALFGHCDPAGSDELNKTLGDRRAIATYALLTRQPDLWAHLHDAPQVGDTWDLRTIQTMLASVPDGQGNAYFSAAAGGLQDAATTAAVRRFQSDAGLAADGEPGPNTRRVLFGAYMDWLCTPPDGSGTAPFRMKPNDFLGGAGARPGDLPKMSLQSCGKLNPVVLLTAEEMGSDGDVGSKADRNVRDAPNRRVIVFFFEKGTTIDPSLWPCPKVEEKGDACKDAFWPEGDARRRNGPKVRLYKDTRDTMACRFYDRFARRSPCEGREELAVLRIRLHDASPRPLEHVRYAYTRRGKRFEGTSEDGWLEVVLRLNERIALRWGSAEGGDDLPFRAVVAPRCYSDNDQEQAIARLDNLGYNASGNRVTAVEAFQRDYAVGDSGLTDEGEIPAQTLAAIAAIYGRDCDATEPRTDESGNECPRE